jgi:hypothetical protein
VFGRSSRRIRHLVFAAGSLYWLVPGHFTLAVTSTPAVDAGSVIGLSWLWLMCYGFDWGRLPAGLARAALLGLCLAAAAAAGSGHALGRSQGLVARYYDNAAFEGPAERSWAAACDACTRIDSQIAFGPRGHAFTEEYFPLFFANDSRRRPWSPGANTSAEGYAFSADWTGFFRVTTPARLRLTGTGGDAEFTVDGTGASRQELSVTAGVHKLTVRYARRTSGPPSLRLEWDFGGGYQMVPAAAFRVDPTPGDAWPSESLKAVGLFAWLAATFLLQFVTGPWSLRRARAAWWGLFQLLFLKALVDIAIAGRAFGFQIFRAGNDYLEYETLARAILSGDILSRIEGPFIHWNFGYRYVLAALHVLAGEAPADVMVIEQAAAALIVVLASATVGRLYGKWSGVATAAVAVGCHQLARLEPPLLDTPWSVGFSAVALFVLLGYLRRPTVRAATAIGLSLGMAGLLRPNLIPLIGAAVIWMAVAHGRAFPGAVRRHALVVVSLSMLLLALLPVRNLIVSRSVRLVPENGLVNLWVGNHPPEFDGPTYFTPMGTPSRAELAGRVLDYCLAEPGSMALRVGRKALYVIGIDVREGVRVVITVLPPWVLAAAGTLFLWRRRAPITRRELTLLWAWVALVNAPLIVVFPWSYGWRLSAPSFIPIYAICGATVGVWLDRHLTTPAPIAGQAAATPPGR